jgi:hypothetical protein
MPRLADRHADNQDAFRRVSTDRVAPVADPTSAFLFECAAWYRTPFSPRSRRLVCQHGGAECSSASVASPTCLAAPRASRRAMRQTDFCLLTFFVRAPAPRRFPMRHALARLRDRGDRLLHIRAIRFGGPHVSSCCHRGGRCLPVAMRVIRTSGISVASPTGVTSLARPAHPWEPPRPPSTRSRERASRMSDPRCLPSSKNLCPATLSRASGSGVSRLRGLATAIPVLDAFSPPGDLAELSEAGSPSTRPAANGSHASLDLGAACRLLQPETTRGHTQRAFNPRTRVGLSPRYSPAPTDAGCVGPRYVAASGACEPRPARAGLRTTCSTCVDRAERGPSRSSKGEPRALGRCRACPSRYDPGTRVTGSIGGGAWRTPSLVAPA